MKRLQPVDMAVSMKDFCVRRVPPVVVLMVRSGAVEERIWVREEGEKSVWW